MADTSSVFYKFGHTRDYEEITFVGPVISLPQLTQSIIEQLKLKATDFNLEIRNAQTDEVYSGSSARIPKSSLLIVKRTAAGWNDGIVKQTGIIAPANSTEVKMQSLEDLAASSSLPEAPKTEEEMLERVIEGAHNFPSEVAVTNRVDPRSGRPIRPPRNYPPPPRYVCRKCGKPGHWIEECKGEKEKMVGKLFGVPTAHLVKDPMSVMKGVNVQTGRLWDGTVASIQSQESRLRDVVRTSHSIHIAPEDVPDLLKCDLCKGLLADTVLLRCCQHIYCHDCVQEFLEKNAYCCPSCQKDLSDDYQSYLIPNAKLRSAVEEFRRNYRSKESKAAEAAKLMAAAEQANSDANNNTLANVGSIEGSDQHAQRVKRQKADTGGVKPEEPEIEDENTKAMSAEEQKLLDLQMEAQRRLDSGEELFTHHENIVKNETKEIVIKEEKVAIYSGTPQPSLSNTNRTEIVLPSPATITTTTVGEELSALLEAQPIEVYGDEEKTHLYDEDNGDHHHRHRVVSPAIVDTASAQDHGLMGGQMGSMMPTDSYAELPIAQPTRMDYTHSILAQQQHQQLQLQQLMTMSAPTSSSTQCGTSSSSSMLLPVHNHVNEQPHLAAVNPMMYGGQGIAVNQMMMPAPPSQHQLYPASSSMVSGPLLPNAINDPNTSILLADQTLSREQFYALQQQLLQQKQRQQQHGGQAIASMGDEEIQEEPVTYAARYGPGSGAPQPSSAHYGSSAPMSRPPPSSSTQGHPRYQQPSSRRNYDADRHGGSASFHSTHEKRYVSTANSVPLGKPVGRGVPPLAPYRTPLHLAAPGEKPLDQSNDSQSDSDSPSSSSSISSSSSLTASAQGGASSRETGKVAHRKVASSTHKSHHGHGHGGSLRTSSKSGNRHRTGSSRPHGHHQPVGHRSSRPMKTEPNDVKRREHRHSRSHGGTELSRHHGRTQHHRPHRSTTESTVQQQTNGNLQQQHQVPSTSAPSTDPKRSSHPTTHSTSSGHRHHHRSHRSTKPSSTSNPTMPPPPSTHQPTASPSTRHGRHGSSHSRRVESDPIVPAADTTSKMDTRPRPREERTGRHRHRDIEEEEGVEEHGDGRRPAQGSRVPPPSRSSTSTMKLASSVVLPSSSRQDRNGPPITTSYNEETYSYKRKRSPDASTSRHVVKRERL